MGILDHQKPIDNEQGFWLSPGRQERKTKCNSRVKKLSGLIVLLGICSGQSQVLYNIHFNGPGQAANQLVVTGSPPTSVSSIVFGSPMVVRSFGALRGQPLRMDMAGNEEPFYYDQIQLNMPAIHPRAINVSFDFTSSGVVGGGGGLTVLFDTPTVRTIDFDNQGVISAFTPFVGDTTFGRFANRREFRFRVHLDLVNHEMRVFKNGVLLGSAPFSPDDYVQDIRFSFGDDFIGGSQDGSAVGIDNIRVRAVGTDDLRVMAVPEPGCLSFVALGAGLIAWCKKKLRAI